MFSGRSVDDLCEILHAGGGMMKAAAGRSTDELCAMARAAAEGGATLYIEGMAGRSVADAVAIARAGQANGRGHVVFIDALAKK